MFNEPPINEIEKDVDINTNFTFLPTDIYKVKIEEAFLKPSESSQSMSFNLNLITVNNSNKQDEKPRKIFIQEWFLSGKTGQPVYKDKKTGKERTLIGYNKLKSLCILVAQKSIKEVLENVTQSKTQLYGKTIEVDFLNDLIGKTFHIGLKTTLVNKQLFNNETQEYEIIADTKTTYSLDKVFITANNSLVTLSEVNNFIIENNSSLETILKNNKISAVLNKFKTNDELFSTVWQQENRGNILDTTVKPNNQVSNNFQSNKENSSTYVNLMGDTDIDDEIPF